MENIKHPQWQYDEMFKILCDATGNSDLANHMLNSFYINPGIFGEYLELDRVASFLTNRTAELTINDNKSGIFSDNFVGQSNFGDEVTDYSVGINSLNFRSPEFVENPEIIFSGCSVSYGVGLPAEATWIESVKNTLNPKSYVALAKPGASSHKIVFTIFKYIFQYGKPKKIFVLFPDPYRISLVSDSVNVTEKSEKTGREMYPVDLHLLRNKKDLVNYSKKPHFYKEILIPEVGFRSTIESIYSLEAFCKAAEIELVWSTWDIHTALMATIINYTDNKMFPNFSILPYKEFHLGGGDPHLGDLNCKSEVYKKYKDHYIHGTDRQKYYGAHVHSHIADGFIEEVRKREAKN